MSVDGQRHAWFSLAIAGSFHFLIFPRKISASTGPVNFRFAVQTFDVVDRHDGAEHRREVENAPGAFASFSSLIGRSVAPKKTVAR